MEHLNDLVTITLNYEGNDIKLQLDRVTAEVLLNDHDQAQHYLKNLGAIYDLQNLPQTEDILDSEFIENGSVSTDYGNSMPADTLQLWTSKRSTTRDIESTELFLQLRSNYSKQFDDKKTKKSQLWKQLGEELKLNGYDLGPNAAERCRQKFANLQKQYLLHIKHIKTTGEKQKDPPAFFDEMHSILGNKDKCNPKNLQDTMDETPNDVPGDIPDCYSSDSGPSTPSESCNTSQSAIRNRFKNISRSAKPKSSNERLIEQIETQHQEDRADRNKHFEVLIDLIKIQNDQRERMLRIMEKRQNKLNHSDSDD